MIRATRLKVLIPLMGMGIPKATSEAQIQA